MTEHNLPPVLTPNEVAALFHVDPKTVSRWSQKGWLKAFRTPGGHRRFHREHILEVLSGGVVDRSDTVARAEGSSLGDTQAR